MHDISSTSHDSGSRTPEVVWYKAISRKQWSALLASNLGWVFDGFESFALVLTAASALRQLLPAADHASIPFYVGAIIGINLLGWGVGGIMGGVMADYLGRKRTMILAILGYSLLTGLSAFSFDWWSFALMRFFVGIAVGSEWATGSSMIAELWPDRARGKAAGLMQCGLGIGFFLASLVWLFMQTLGPDAWRYIYLVGVLPALLTLWIRRSIPESEKWEQSAKRRKEAAALKRTGATLTEDQVGLTTFTLVDLFSDKSLRGRTIIVFIMSLSTTFGFWGISTWVPPFIAASATAQGLNGGAWASYAGMAYTTGSVLGYIALGFAADAWGRKPVTLIYFTCALALTPVLFFTTRDPATLLLLASLNAFFSNGLFTWMPIWLPELYPTRVRATALAFAFNGPRFFAFVGPLVGGSLVVSSGGFGQAAMAVALIYVLGILATPLLPETRGKPLPE